MVTNMFETIKIEEARVRNYRILSEDNVEDISKMTGLSKVALEEKLDQSRQFGDVEVFWRVLRDWYNVRVSGEYVYSGMLPHVVEEAMYISMSKRAS